MEEVKLFTAFYHLSELRSREDLIKGIIENIDYSMFVFLHSRYRLFMSLSDGHPRIVLSKALTSSYKVCGVRYYSPYYLCRVLAHKTICHKTPRRDDPPQSNRKYLDPPFVAHATL
jgi:rapamycin-insensitive companion of mTOR